MRAYIIAFVFGAGSTTSLLHAWQNDHSLSPQNPAQAVQRASLKAIQDLEIKAQQGDSDAQCELAIRYGKGDGVPKNHPKSFQWATKAAAQHNPKSYSILFTCYLQGLGCPPDRQKALESLKNGAAAGDEMSQTNLSTFLYYRELGIEMGIAPNPRKAIEWAIKAARKGNIKAIRILADAYINGKGVDQDAVIGMEYMEQAAQESNNPEYYRETGEASLILNRNGYPPGSMDHAEQYFMKAAILGDQQAMERCRQIRQLRADANQLQQRIDQGDEHAICELGQIYIQGIEYSPLDREKGIQLLQKASDQGSLKASALLGMAYISGQGIKKNIPLGMDLLQKSASAGDRDAQYELGELLSADQDEIQQNMVQATEWLQKSAAQGHAKAQNSLGLLYLNGQGVKRNERTAFHWIHMSARQNLAIAQHNLGSLYMRGQGTEQNYREATRWYQHSAEQGMETSMPFLGTLYSLGGFGIAKNYQEAVKWFQISAKQGNVDSIVSLGKIYLNGGPGIEKNWGEAAKWFHLAADLGNEISIPFLRYIYIEGGPGLEKNYGEAVKWLKLCLEQGDKEAVPLLTRLYMSGGFGLEQDYKEAVKWLQKSFEQGNATAAYNLGVLYMTGGPNLVQDSKQAIRWWEQAAALNDADSQRNLAVLAIKGDLVPKNYKEAEKWLLPSARQGHAESQYRLGIIHEEGGYGLVQDLPQARDWYQKAARQGHEEAKQALEQLNDHSLKNKTP